MKKLSVIIPAHNEAARIEHTVVEVNAYLEKQNYDYEIIVVDNWSNDHTGELVKKLSMTTVPKASVIFEGRPGKGIAVKSAVEVATGDFIMYMDADNATPISEIEKFWPHLDEGVEVVIGDRYLDQQHKAHQPLLRTILSRGSNLLIQIVLIPHINDTQAGFKGFKGSAAKEIFKHISIFGFAFDMELLALALKLGYRIKAVPITRDQEGGSTVPPSAFIKSFIDLFKIKWRMITNYYKLK